MRVRRALEDTPGVPRELRPQVLAGVRPGVTGEVRQLPLFALAARKKRCGRAGTWHRRDHRRSQREERLDVLDARMTEVVLIPHNTAVGIDLRRYGTRAARWLGLGFERTISYITGLANVRDVILPRMTGNARY